MKCSKCGHENPSENLFCEECDWRLDVKYKPEKKRNPYGFAAFTLILGIASAILVLMELSVLGGTIVGAVGMVIGGYSTGVARHICPDGNNIPLVLSGLGLVLGVVGFLIGFSALAGAL